MTIPKLKIKKNGESDGNAMTVEYTNRFEDSPTTSVSVTPIVTYPAESSFAYDIASTENISASFEHKHSTETGKYTNKEFIDKLRSYINRWQAKTDGNVISFDTSGTDDSEYYPPFIENAYIKQISTTYRAGQPEYITGSINAVVGSMYCKETQQSVVLDDYGAGEKIYDKYMYITISSSNGYNVYPIYINTSSNESYTCVDGYTLSCGPLTPFPMITMRLSKKRLANIAPDLVGDIIAGKNLISVNAAGNGTFLVTKCSLSNNIYTITGYSLEESYRGLTLKNNMECGQGKAYQTPFETIRALLIQYYNINNNITITVPSKKILYLVNSNNNIWSSKNGDQDIPSFNFTTDQTVWEVLQICALKLNAQIYFMNGYALIIDPTLSLNDSGVYTNISADSTIYKEYVTKTYLNYRKYDTLSNKQKALCNSIVSTPSLGDEGSDTLYNYIYIKCGNGAIRYTDSTDTIISGSISAFGKKKAQILDFEGKMMVDDAQAIANNYMKRLCDTQQSVSFTVAERSNEQIGNELQKCWHSYYPVFAHLNAIVDYNSDTYITNLASFSSDTRMRNKLALSKIKRSFPDFTSTYTFGAMANADLTQTTSQILGSL